MVSFRWNTPYCERPILKTDERKIVLELTGGKFAAKSTGWDENRVFLEGDKLEVAVKNGR